MCNLVFKCVYETQTGLDYYENIGFTDYGPQTIITTWMKS